MALNYNLKDRKFLIGSHDTMSYAKPKAWYLRPFHFMAKCQSANIVEQYNKHGVRLFDLRVKWSEKEDKWVFAHGLMEFDTPDLDDVLKWINGKGDCYVRLVLEYNRPPKQIMLISIRFTNLCRRLVEQYSNIQFFEFTRKYDWAKLYHSDKEPQIDMYQATSSTTGKILDDLWPWLYAWCFNKDNLIQGTDHQYMLMDFIGCF